MVHSSKRQHGPLARSIHGRAQHELFAREQSYLLEEVLQADRFVREALAQIEDEVLQGHLLGKELQELPIERRRRDYGVLDARLVAMLAAAHALAHMRAPAAQIDRELTDARALLTRLGDERVQVALVLLQRALARLEVVDLRQLVLLPLAHALLHLVLHRRYERHAIVLRFYRVIAADLALAGKSRIGHRWLHTWSSLACHARRSRIGGALEMRNRLRWLRRRHRVIGVVARHRIVGCHGYARVVVHWRRMVAGNGRRLVHGRWHARRHARIVRSVGGIGHRIRKHVGLLLRRHRRLRRVRTVHSAAAAVVLMRLVDRSGSSSHSRRGVGRTSVERRLLAELDAHHVEEQVEVRLGMLPLFDARQHDATVRVDRLRHVYAHVACGSSINQRIILYLVTERREEQMNRVVCSYLT